MSGRMLYSCTHIMATVGVKWLKLYLIWYLIRFLESFLAFIQIQVHLRHRMKLPLTEEKLRLQWLLQSVIQQQILNHVSMISASILMYLTYRQEFEEVHFVSLCLMTIAVIIQASSA